MQRFGEFARIARERKRVSLRQLASALEISAPYLSDIERGFRNPLDDQRLEKWAALIDVDRDEFMRRAKLERRSVEIPVNYDPRKAEFAMQFARSIDVMTPEQQEQILKILRSGSKNDEESE